MGKQYLEKYDLTEIFGNEKLRGKLPIIKYKATETGSGRTQIKSVPFPLSPIISLFSRISWQIS